MASVIAMVFATLAVAVLASKAEASLVAPASLFALMWAGYICSGALFITDAATIRMGLVWIWVSVFTVYVGAVSAGPFIAPSLPRTPRVGARGVEWLRILCRATLVVGVANIVDAFAARGFSVSRMFSWVVITQVSAANRADTFTGDAYTSVLQRLAFVVLLLGAIYGGLLFRLAQRRRDYALGLGTVFVVSALHALYGSRMGVLYGGGLWLSAYLAAHVAMSDAGRGVNVRFLAGLGIAAVVILVGLSTLAQALRYVATQRQLDWGRMLSNPFGFIGAFGIWFDAHGLDPATPLYGARIFRRVYEFVGIRHELQPSIEVGFMASNIYTVFRDLIEDFGLLGSLCATTLFGVVGRLSFAATINGGLQALPWLVLVYGVAITSFASGLLSYTTSAVAVATFIVTFRWLPAVVEDEVVPEHADRGIAMSDGVA